MGPLVATKFYRGDGIWMPVSHYNSIRNPGMVIGNRGASGTVNDYTLDGWWWQKSGTYTITWSQITPDIPADTSGSNWYPFITYALRITIGTTQASFTGTNYFWFTQYVEGPMADPLIGQPTSISFLARSSKTGTYAVIVRDNAASYTYIAPFTISVANVWTRITIPNIPAFPALGSFPAAAGGACYHIGIALAGGVTYASSIINQWTAGNFVGYSGQTNLPSTASATFDFTAFQHEPGPVCTPYIRREMVQEYALNRRYFINLGSSYMGWVYNATWLYDSGEMWIPRMCKAPAFASPAPTFTVATGSAGTPVLFQSSSNAIAINNQTANNWTPSSTTPNWAYINGLILTAEL